MTHNEKLEALKNWEFRRSAYEMALSVINYDKMTVAPVAGADYRDARTAYLSGELFEISVNPAIIDVLKDLTQMRVLLPGYHESCLGSER